jgi:AcrR family transcriptional regulator
VEIDHEMAHTKVTAVRSKRRTQAERRLQSSTGLVKAAIDVISTEGVGATTFETIAQRGRYSRALVSKRFGSKQGLIEAVIAYLRARPEAMAIERRVDELTGFQALLAYIDLYMHHLATDENGQAYYRLLSSALADKSPLQAIFFAEHERFHARLSDIVRRGQVEGNIRRDLDPDSAAFTAGGIVFSIAMSILMNPSINLSALRRSSSKTLIAAFAVAPRKRRARRPTRKRK